MDQESGIQASGKAPAPGEPVTASLEPSTAPSLSSGYSQMGIGFGTVIGVVVLLLVLFALYRYRNCILQGCGADTRDTKSVPICCLPVTKRPEALDNDRNIIISGRESPSSLASEQELDRKEHREEHTEPAGVMVQSPGEAEPLLGPEGADGSRIRRGHLVPANKEDPIECLKTFFDYFTEVVPFDSWNPLMRLLGLKHNDIQVARAQASNPREALYEMLMTWVNSTGQAASINTVLDALEKLEERNAKETIQKHLLESGKYVYEEGEAGSAVS